MSPLTEEQKQRIWEQIASLGIQPFEGKEEEQLSVMVRSKAMLKAFGTVYSSAQSASTAISSLDFGLDRSRVDAARLQGRMEGMIQAVELVLELVTAEEEQEVVGQ